MSDFFQTGAIATLHRLGPPSGLGVKGARARGAPPGADDGGPRGHPSGIRSDIHSDIHSDTHRRTPPPGPR